MPVKGLTEHQTEVEERALYVSVRIDSINPVHTRISVFQGYSYHPTDTRGHAGSLCLDTPVTADFIKRLNPVQITLADGVELPDWLKVQGE